MGVGIGIARKKNVVLQMWRSFVLFILIPVVLLNIAIFYLLHDMEQTAENMARTRLSHAQFLLDQNITDSLAAAEKIGSNYNIQKMSTFQDTLTPEDYGTLWEIKEFRQSMVTVNDAYSINILCNGSNIFMTESSLCMDLDQFYPSAYAFGDVPLEALKKYGHKGSQVTFYPFARFRSGETWRDGIFYTMVLTPYAGENTGATAIVFLNEENLQGIFGEFGVWDALTYLMDANGQILYQTGNEELQPQNFPVDTDSRGVYTLPTAYFGRKNFAISSNITTGLQIVSVIPKENLFMQMGRLRIFIWILNVTTIVMCLSLSLRLARKRSRILSGALDLMHHNTGNEEIDQNENVFHALYNSVSNMVDANTSLQNALGAQKELLASVFWSRVLSVNSMTDEEIRRLAQSAGISLDAAGYCLLLVGLRSEKDMDAEHWNLLLQKRRQMLDELNQDDAFFGYVGSSGMDQLVILMPLKEAQCSAYQNVIAEEMTVLKKMMEQDIMVFCVGSTVFHSLGDMYSAYVRCGNQMNLCSSYLETKSIIWCSEEELGTESSFYYTDELKNQIVLWIKSGQQELVKEGFRRILEENYLKRTISGRMELLLIAKLKLTLLSAYDSRMTIDMTEVFEHIDEIQTDALMFSYVLRVAMDMCGHYLAGIRSHEDGMQKKITAYIDGHFMEYGFGLSTIAEHCNLSETYFSQIFKEVMGENFSTYVEKKRMAYAYKLIVESDMTIDMVAEKTGYSNTNAFRKAYKRFYGISPSQSRKNKAE